jgi:hypothetical protein
MKSKVNKKTLDTILVGLVILVILIVFLSSSNISIGGTSQDNKKVSCDVTVRTKLTGGAYIDSAPCNVGKCGVLDSLSTLSIFGNKGNIQMVTNTMITSKSYSTNIFDKETYTLTQCVPIDTTSTTIRLLDDKGNLIEQRSVTI